MSKEFFNCRPNETGTSTKINFIASQNEQKEAEDIFQNEQEAYKEVAEDKHEIPENKNISENIKIIKVDEVHQFYSKCFKDYFKMKKWAIANRNYGYFIDDELVGALTLKTVEFGSIKIADVLLVAVAELNRHTGIGRSLIEFARKQGAAVVLWGDNSAKGFYIKLGFTKDNMLGYSMQPCVEYFTRSQFFYAGLEKDTVTKLKEREPWKNKPTSKRVRPKKISKQLLDRLLKSNRKKGDEN